MAEETPDYAQFVPTIDPFEALMNGEGPKCPIVTSFRDVHEVFTSRGFVNAGWDLHPTSWAFLKKTILNLEGEEHNQRSRIVKPLFARDALIRYEREVLVPSIERSVAELTADGDGWVRVDLVPFSRKVMTRIAATMIGLDDSETSQRTDRLAYFCSRISIGTGIKFASGDLDELSRGVLTDKDAFVEEFVEPSVVPRRKLVDAFKRGELKESDLPNDLITLLLIGQTPDWDDDLLNREVIVYLVSSTLTTVQSVPHAMYHIDRWIGSHPEDRVHLKDPEWLRHAAYESLRLHTSAPTQFRQAATETTIGNGMSFHEGEEIAVCASQANRDASVYGENPDVYDAHRPAPGGGRRLYGHSFAAGRHRCIGEHLAVGMPARRGEDNGTLGMVVSFLKALCDREAKLESEFAPTRNPIMRNDFYSAMPIRFRG